MKIACLVTLMFVIASGYAQRPLSDEKQILKLEDDWARALKMKDRQLLDAIVSPNFTFIEPDGTVKNRDDYLADRSSDIADIESFELGELRVRVFENCALTSGISRITERRQGKRYRFSLRWKELWLKDNGSWRVVASQATPVNPAWDTGFVVKLEKDGRVD
ncbi:MAG TPA: nuclear transport factor 2 family protein [Candidatus Udaeobacter sp.]|jgi:ketosteroid isomerase-like protein|nr:nuclear transport factor 2 family protein [Candidatus Udaeobacter sp.]